MSLGVGWEGLIISWKVLKADWEGLRAGSALLHRGEAILCEPLIIYSSLRTSGREGCVINTSKEGGV